MEFLDQLPNERPRLRWWHIVGYLVTCTTGLCVGSAGGWRQIELAYIERYKRKWGHYDLI